MKNNTNDMHSIQAFANEKSDSKRIIKFSYLNIIIVFEKKSRYIYKK